MRGWEPPRPGVPLVEPVPRPSNLDLSPGLPGYLLLLPAGILPGVLAVASRLRRGRRPPWLHRRDALPVDPAEHPPLLPLLRVCNRRHPGSRCRRSLPVPRFGDRGERRYPGAVGERGAHLALHPVVPFVPPHLRRP